MKRFKILDDKKVEFENEIEPNLPSGGYLVTIESIVIYDELVFDILQHIQSYSDIEIKDYFIMLDDI